jgi:hypothetical protein
VTLASQRFDCPQDSGLLPRVTDNKTQLFNLSTGLTSEFDNFVNKNHGKVVDHEPAQVFKIIGGLRTSCAR